MINGNGKQTRSFLFIDDCIDAFYKIFKKNINNEVFNIGSDNEISMIDLAKKLKKFATQNQKLSLIQKKFTKVGGYEDILRRVPSVDKLKKQIKWIPSVNLDRGLEIMKHNIKKNAE